MKKDPYKITEVKPRIFYLDFKSQYDCNMMFMRYQEYYESPNPKFRGKSFNWMDFMEWYSQKYGNGVFTYAVDWAGFNIPGKLVKEVWEKGIYDRTVYDYEMKMVYERCLGQYPDGRFYIIAGVGQGWAMKHETAHGFFYTTPKYKREMTKLVKSLPKKFYKSICKDLERIGYAPKVYIDECQAYLSTGFPDNFDTRYRHYKPFVDLYNKYYNA